MAACDLCGKQGNLQKAMVEGTMMEVCMNCAKFGSPIRAPTSTYKKPVKKDVLESIDVIPDYTAVIKSKRESLGLKQEHLAKKMGVKESIIHNVESGRMHPTIELAKKFEKALNITLLQKEE